MIRQAHLLSQWLEKLLGKAHRGRTRNQSSVLSGTIFLATKLPLTRWFLAMHLLTQSKNNVAALEL